MTLKLGRAAFAVLFSVVATNGMSVAQGAADAPPVAVQRDLTYGTGITSASTDRHARDLKMDAYLPTADGPVPAVIMMFGGAFHRGEKGAAHFTEGGAQDSSMADYCGVIARHGYACFSIEYRLTPEDPALPDLPADALTIPKAIMQDPGAMSRINIVRGRMDLPPLDETSREQYWAATFAAAEDLSTALEHVRSEADAYNIDPEQIAIGGFSAGAISVLNLGYGAKADVAGVVSLSGTVSGYNILASSAEGDPPLLMFAGQNDLAGIQWGSREIARTFPAKGIDVEMAWVAGFGHFYPMGAVSLGAEYSRLSVEARLLAFFDRVFAK